MPPLFHAQPSVPALPTVLRASRPASRTVQHGVLWAMAALMAGCASRAPVPADHAEWGAQHLPGKAQTEYRWTEKEGRAAKHAVSKASASLWRKRLATPIEAPNEVTFSWWVQDIPPEASVAVAEREDAAARVVFAFDGDKSQLPMRTRAMFELAHALSGEAPPYATLMYVWDSQLPVGTVVVNPRSDRIRKIVVDSGREGLRQWREHQRDLAADFRLAFGEAPGKLTGVAVMSDSDNTRSRVETWYGPVSWPGKAAVPGTAAR